MQVTIDIPDAVYLHMEAESVAKGLSVQDWIVRVFERAIDLKERFASPSKRPSFIDLDPNLNDFALMSDDEYELFEKIAALDAEAAANVFGIRRATDSSELVVPEIVIRGS